MAASEPIVAAGGSSSEKQEFILNVDGSSLYDHKGVSRRWKRLQFEHFSNATLEVN